MAATAPATSPLPLAKRILVCSPKGGVGKTTLVRSFMVCAERAGKRVVAVDFDPQHSLFKWGKKRTAKTGLTGATPVEVLPGDLTDWRSSVDEAASRADFVLIDTPPSVELKTRAVRALCEHADLVLVPTSYTDDDLDSVGPWMKSLLEANVNAAFCLNRVNSRAKLYGVALKRLNKVGRVCPIEVPDVLDMVQFANAGLTPFDMPKAKGTENIVGVWDFVTREMR